MYKEFARGLGKFIIDNDDIQLAKDGILIHLLEREFRLHVMIEVDEDATQDRLRNIIPLACEWRDRVMKYQGAWRGGGNNEFYERLHEMQKAGISYTKLAKLINDRVEKWLCEAVAFDEVFRKIRPSLKTKQDYYTWAYSKEQKLNPHSIDHARGPLESLGYKESDIEEWLNDGIERIKAGQEPFESGGPVTRDKVISALRTWRTGKKHLSIEAVDHKGW